MQTHKDLEHEFMDKLKGRASQMIGQSMITAGKPGEKPLSMWEARGVHVVQLPPDEQKILRISIGGGRNLPVLVNYCTFRGDRQHCITLLETALEALKVGPITKRNELSPQSKLPQP